VGASGHHGGAFGAVVGGWGVCFRGRAAADSSGQAGEQQRAAGGGDVVVPGRGGQYKRPVGELFFGPPQKRFDQMANLAVTLEVDDKSGIYPLPMVIGPAGTGDTRLWR